MNENSGKKRREWVKNAAIIFLSVMLVLTFFSNTFMNYSLPEVAAQYVQSGTITAKIRRTGRTEPLFRNQAGSQWTFWCYQPLPGKRTGDSDQDGTGSKTR